MSACCRKIKGNESNISFLIYSFFPFLRIFGIYFSYSLCYWYQSALFTHFIWISFSLFFVQPCVDKSQTKHLLPLSVQCMFSWIVVFQPSCVSSETVRIELIIAIKNIKAFHHIYEWMNEWGTIKMRSKRCSFYSFQLRAQLYDWCCYCSCYFASICCRYSPFFGL